MFGWGLLFVSGRQSQLTPQPCPDVRWYLLVFTVDWVKQKSSIIYCNSYARYPVAHNSWAGLLLVYFGQRKLMANVSEVQVRCHAKGPERSAK